LPNVEQTENIKEVEREEMQEKQHFGCWSIEEEGITNRMPNMKTFFKLL